MLETPSEEEVGEGLELRTAAAFLPAGDLRVRGIDPRTVALYAVELVRRVPGGQVYPFSSYASWLRETGFERIDRIELTSCPPVTLVRARRP